MHGAGCHDERGSEFHDDEARCRVLLITREAPDPANGILVKIECITVRLRGHDRMSGGRALDGAAGDRAPAAISTRFGMRGGAPGNAINTEDIATGLAIFRIPRPLKLQHLRKAVGLESF